MGDASAMKSLRSPVVGFRSPTVGNAGAGVAVFGADSPTGYRYERSELTSF